MKPAFTLKALRSLPLLLELLTICISTICILNSCMEAPKPLSSSKYGSLTTGYLLDRRAIGLVPGQSIGFCGNQAQEGARALKVWADVIGRDFPITFSEDCRFAEPVDQLISVRDQQVPHPRIPSICKKVLPYTKNVDCKAAGGTFYRGICREGNYAHHAITSMYKVPKGYAAAVKSEVKDGETIARNIIRSESCYRLPLYQTVSLHEFGHIWGLCDQYSVNPEGVVSAFRFHENCDPIYRSEKPPQSAIMVAGTETITALQPDDILAIKIMACRKDIAANQVWFQASVERSKVLSSTDAAEGRAWHDDPILHAEMKRLGEERFLAECILASESPAALESEFDLTLQ